MNAMCAPVRPGVALKTNLESEAPWWAPVAKSSAFAFCGKRPRTNLSWTIGTGGKNKLSILSLDGEVPTSIFEKQPHSAVVHSGYISVTDKKGVSTDLKSPWAL